MASPTRRAAGALLAMCSSRSEAITRQSPTEDTSPRNCASRTTSRICRTLAKRVGKWRGYRAGAIAKKKAEPLQIRPLFYWLRGRDLNPRPLGYEPLIAKPPGTAQGNKARISLGESWSGGNPRPPETAPDCPRFVPAKSAASFLRLSPPWLASACASSEEVRRG